MGVASLRRLLLAEGADHFTLEAAEAFGQSEALTTRLKHITCGLACPCCCITCLRLLQRNSTAVADSFYAECSSVMHLCLAFASLWERTLLQGRDADGLGVLLEPVQNAN